MKPLPAAAAPPAPCAALARGPAIPHAGVRWAPRPAARRGDSLASRASQLPTTPDGLVQAGPRDPQPDYAAIDAAPLNRLVYTLFRAKMVAALGGQDSPLQGYPAIIDLTRRLNAAGSPAATQAATRGILRSLFPSWLPGAFKVMFAGPLPELSCRLNAFATAATCQWLMGDCAVNDVEIDGGGVGTGHGVLVTRCRYLEDAGCVAVCINSCKVPTQTFFLRDMGLPLTMTPNYETFECQFAFGATPPAVGEDEAYDTPCFEGCPTARAGGAACHRIGAPQDELEM